MIRWTFGLSVTYAAIVGFLMIMKNQSVSAFFFLADDVVYGAVTAYAVDAVSGIGSSLPLLEAPEDQRGLPVHRHSGLSFLLVPESGPRR